MELNSKGFACATTFSGSINGEFDLGVKRMSDDDVLNRVMSFVNQHPNDENIHEAAMDLLDELLN